jgi:hypothetical protein
MDTLTIRGRVYFLHDVVRSALDLRLETRQAAATGTDGSSAVDEDPFILVAERRAIGERHGEALPSALALFYSIVDDTALELMEAAFRWTKIRLECALENKAISLRSLGFELELARLRMCTELQHMRTLNGFLLPSDAELERLWIALGCP